MTPSRRCGLRPRTVVTERNNGRTTTAAADWRRRGRPPGTRPRPRLRPFSAGVALGRTAVTARDATRDPHPPETRLGPAPAKTYRPVKYRAVPRSRSAPAGVGAHHPNGARPSRRGGSGDPGPPRSRSARGAVRTRESPTCPASPIARVITADQCGSVAAGGQARTGTAVRWR